MITLQDVIEFSVETKLIGEKKLNKNNFKMLRKKTLNDGKNCCALELTKLIM